MLPGFEFRKILTDLFLQDYPVIGPYLVEKERDSYFPQGNSTKEKTKQFCPGFELGSSSSYLNEITVLLCASDTTP